MLSIVGDLGGAAGLFMGASLLTLLETFYIIGIQIRPKKKIETIEDKPAIQEYQNQAFETDKKLVKIGQLDESNPNIAI